MKLLPVLLILLLAASAFCAGCTAPQAPAVTPGPAAPAPSPVPEDTARMASVARNLSASIDTELADLRAGLKNTTSALGTADLSSPEAGSVLSDNLLRYPWAVSSVIIDTGGTIRAAVPKNYAGIVGKNVIDDDIFRAANRTRAPLISSVFRLAEGFDGVVQSYPLFSPSGEYRGYADITYEPSAILNERVAKALACTPYDVWITETSGRVIFDSHKEEVGTNILSDPAYADPGMQAVFTRIARDTSGTGTYTFHDDAWNGTVTKTAVWDTAGIDGVEWRVVVTASRSAGPGTAGPVPGTLLPATASRYANLTGFVDRAAAYAQARGKAAALAEFNNRNGSFIDGELYVFAYEMNGTVIALPFQPDLLGTDRSGITDPNGVAFIRGLADTARDGGGSFYYIYPNPADGYREEFKLSVVRPVDSTWFVGSGIYLPDLPARFNASERSALVLRVKQAQRYAQEAGPAKALAAFNDRNGTYADGSRYIFAYAMNGTALALPFQPEVIGTNRMNYTDPYGVKVMVLETAAADRGGGFVYVDYLNPDNSMPGLKLCYVAPVDGDWFVGSGIYTSAV